MKKVCRKVLSVILAIIMLMSLMQYTVFATSYGSVVAVISGVNVGKLERNTSSSNNQYSSYWQYWSQGASKYSTNGSGGNGPMHYGCHVIAKAKMLVEMGLASGDKNVFNPDILFDWGKGSYWRASDTLELSDAAIGYANSKGYTMKKTTCSLSGQNLSSDNEIIMQYLREGYYVCLYCPSHMAYVGRDISLAKGQAVLLNSWASWSYNQAACHTFLGADDVFFTSLFAYKLSGGSTPTTSITLTWNPLDSVYAVYETDAVLGRSLTVSGTAAGNVSQVGIQLYDSNKDYLTGKTEKAIPLSNGEIRMWYYVNDELGYTLTHGTQYYYCFVAVINGTTYYSPTYSFITGGTYSISVDRLPTKTAYYVGDRFSSDGLRISVSSYEKTFATLSGGFQVSTPDLSSPGTKTVTVTYDDRTTSFPITVTTPTVSLSASSKTLTVGDTVTLTATTTPAGQSVTWTSSDPSVATVSNGTVTAKAAGKATVTAKFVYNGITYSDTCTVTVAGASAVVPGDGNGDGRVTVADVRLALRSSVNKVTLTDTQKAALDVNGDGRVTVADVRLLLRYSVNKISHF